MTKIPPEWKYLRNTVDLIYLADIDYLVCKRIYGEIANKKEKDFTGKDFLILSANNALHESLEILYTLLCSPKKEELRIKPLLEEVLNKEGSLKIDISEEKVQKLKEAIERDYPSPDYFSYDFLKKDDDRMVGDIIADIRKKDRMENGLKDLKRIKDKFEKFGFHKIRHQSSAHKNKLLDSPAGAANLLIKDSLIEDLGDIVKDLMIHSYFWFDYSTGNPYGFILKSLENIVSKK